MLIATLILLYTSKSQSFCITIFSNTLFRRLYITIWELHALSLYKPLPVTSSASDMHNSLYSVCAGDEFKNLHAPHEITIAIMLYSMAHCHRGSSRKKIMGGFCGCGCYTPKTTPMWIICCVEGAFEHTYRKFMACVCHRLQCKNTKYTSHIFPVQSNLPAIDCSHSVVDTV